MRILRDLLLMTYSAALLTSLACNAPRVDASKRGALQSQMNDWKGKAIEDFQKTTGWQATGGRRLSTDGTLRVVTFDASEASDQSPAAQPLTYHHTTQWTNNLPGQATTGGANQPLEAAPSPSTVRTETVRIPVARTGCRLTVWVDAKGLINSWRMDGSECFPETLDRLKRR